MKSYKNRFTAIVFFELIMVLTVIVLLLGIDVFAKDEKVEKSNEEAVVVQNEAVVTKEAFF